MFAPVYLATLLVDVMYDQWTADDLLPAAKIGGDSSTGHRTFNVTLAPHDEIRIEGIPDRDEHAALDYIEILPAPSPGALN